MSRSLAQLRADALRIWRAGVDAVRAETLIGQAVRVDGETLFIEDESVDLKSVGRIVVVGAGKAGAGMAAEIEEVLGPQIAADKHLTGWINVPADCVRPLRWIRLHAARAAGQNEPTAEGVTGSHAILSLVESLTPDDLCICLISGGGSALLPAQVSEITLADKLAVTKHLSAAGANIQELNTVRKQLSRIKGGGLARACNAGRLVSRVIISDVLGDPLDIIASGPTVPDSSTPRAALEILARFRAREAGISPRVFEYLENKANGATQGGRESSSASILASNKHSGDDDSRPLSVANCKVTNIIMGNNAVAVDAAGVEAERLGYSHAMISSPNEGTAEEVGRHLAEMAVRMKSQPGPNCLISGGEPVVKLIDAAERGLGGRNQQLVLAALIELQKQPPTAGIVLLSGGTDGEDGPTDAAGAVCDAEIIAAAKLRGLDPADFLRRNDAYHFFEAAGGLIKTGPTQTNVCDLRVVVIDKE